MGEGSFFGEGRGVDPVVAFPDGLISVMGIALAAAIGFTLS
jgi:hypothetical protein